MTNEQYLALSKLAYVEFNDNINGTVESAKDAIKAKFGDYETNPIIQKILPSLNDWKVVAHQLTTRNSIRLDYLFVTPS